MRKKLQYRRKDMKLKRIAIIVFFTTLFLMIGITVSKASYSASNPTVNSGEKVSISVTSSTALEAYNLDLQSNGGLTFNSCSKSKENDGDIINISGSSIGYMNMSGTTKKLGTYTFTAPTVTEKKTYNVIFKVDQSTEIPATVTVNPVATTNPSEGGTTSEPKKGSVTFCEVDGIKIKESRNVENKESVIVKVKTSTGEGLKIYNSKTKKSYPAKSEEEIRVQVLEGTNTLTITLDSGTKITRKVYNKKKEETKPNIEEPSQTEPEQPDENQEVVVGLQSLVIKGVTEEDNKVTLPFTPEFASDVYEYQMLLDESFSLDYTELEVEAVRFTRRFCN